MSKTGVLTELLKMYIDTSTDPYLGAMRDLPANVLDALLADFVKNANVSINANLFNISFDMDRFRERIKGAYQRHVLHDEVGILIRYGASKNVISEVTGVHQSKVVSKRKLMTAETPKLGRPRELDEAEKQYIADIWQNTEGCRVTRLVQTHYLSRVSINDVWLTVRDIKPKPLGNGNSHVH